MSYILDALRKAERERSLGQAPTLDTHYVVAAASSSRLPPWLLGGGGALAVVLVFALVMGLRSEPEIVAEEEEVIPELAVVEPTAPAPEPAAPAPPPPAVATVTVQTAEGPLQAEIPAIPPAPPPPDAFETESAEAEPPLAELPAGEPPEEAIGPDTPEEPAAFVPRGRARLDIPSYDGLPDSVRGSMPQLSMNAHVFSSVPGRGFVMVNNKKYREGDVLAEGPEVVEILPEGVVLRYRATDFLLPVPR